MRLRTAGLTFILFFLLSPFAGFSFDSTRVAKKDSAIVSLANETFLSGKLILSESAALTPKNSIELFIGSRFGTITAGGGLHTLFGVDEIADYRIGINYGLTNRLQVGLGRSKFSETLDGSVKFRFLEQKPERRCPITAVMLLTAGLTTKPETDLYPAGAIVEGGENFAHRISYLSEIIIARKFSAKVSAQVLGGYHHRNLITDVVNSDNLSKDSNGIPFMGLGLSLGVNNHIRLLADYFYIISRYRLNNLDFSSPLSVGVQVAKSGYSITCSLSNTPLVAGINFIPQTNGDWKKGKINFGITLVKTLGI